MAVIKPTLSLTANSSAASTDPGPLSIALSLSATDSLTVDTVDSTADYDIYVGAVADGTSASTLDDADDAVRLFTLKQGEFAFLPYDYTMDLVVDAENADATLEYWLFNRA